MWRFDTATIQAGHRLAYWKDGLCNRLLALEIEPLDRRERQFHGRMDVATIGNGQLVRLSSCGQRALRSTACISRDDVPALLVNLVLRGRGETRQHGRTLEFGAGQLFIHDSMSPYSLEMWDEFEIVTLRVPVSFASQYVSRPDRIALLPLGGASATSRMASALLRELAAMSGDLDDDDGMFAVAHLLPFIGAAAAAAGPEGSERLAPTYLRLLRHIDRNIVRPDFGSAALAAECGLSMRQLSRTFANEGETATGVIRKKRLERARLLLLSRLSVRRTIAEVAFDCGFANAAHFSEIFAVAYGVPPRAYRAAGALRRNLVGVN